MVYVLNINGKSLMPCKEAKARKLLRVEGRKRAFIHDPKGIVVFG